MIKKIKWLFVATTLFVCGVAMANPLFSHKDNTLTDPSKGNTGGTKIDDVAFNAGVWTGWMRVETMQSLCFDVSFTRSAATGVTMRCESSESYSTANDAGYDIHAYSLAVVSGSGSTLTSEPMTWTYTVSATKKWSWCVDELPGRYINCLFDDVASGGASDKLTVVARGVTP